MADGAYGIDGVSTDELMCALPAGLAANFNPWLLTSCPPSTFRMHKYQTYQRQETPLSLVINYQLITVALTMERLFHSVGWQTSLYAYIL